MLKAGLRKMAQRVANWEADDAMTREIHDVSPPLRVRVRVTELKFVEL